MNLYNNNSNYTFYNTKITQSGCLVWWHCGTRLSGRILSRQGVNIKAQPCLCVACSVSQVSDRFQMKRDRTQTHSNLSSADSSWTDSHRRSSSLRPRDACLRRTSTHQIKSNHFYCHITTAQVPWWVKFLWACSRQCRKTTDNLPMDRQCKKNSKQFTYGQTVQKNNKQFTYGQTVQKKQQTIYIWTDSAKKTANNLHMDRQCKKNNNCNLHMDRQCKKTTAIYIWTVHIYRLYRRQCAKYTYMHSVRLVYYRDILNYQRHIIHRMGTSTLCTVSIHNVVYT